MNNTTQLLRVSFIWKRSLCFAVHTSCVMAKWKCPSPLPSGSGSDNIAHAPTRNVRQKRLHLAPTPSPASTSSRTVDFVLIPRGERPSEDELSTPVEDVRKPHFDRPLIISGKRSRTQNSQRRTLKDLWGLAQPSEKKSPRALPLQLDGTAELSIDTPEPPALPAPKSLTSATGGASKECSENVSRNSSRRSRRSTLR